MQKYFVMLPASWWFMMRMREGGHNLVNIISFQKIKFLIQPPTTSAMTEEEELWENKELGSHSPQVLINSLVYFNTKLFHLTVRFTSLRVIWFSINVHLFRLISIFSSPSLMSSTRCTETRRTRCGAPWICTISTFQSVRSPSRSRTTRSTCSRRRAARGTRRCGSPPSASTGPPWRKFSQDSSSMKEQSRFPHPHQTEILTKQNLRTKLQTPRRRKLQ